ncbi:quinone oxidoreductase family protein [Rhizobium halophytocola]|uniref:NADPH2:quinone reductase n=1 Tax=Rhizobium halophytocola TaxID=735519 RepID=A0ABS4DSG9_9HYPH|nr:quinone oxidoreductase [Rhizobium halophytocola]MBP1848634.1 NADPH2:quinone reductase [Rhizobium halophytocola]
MRAIQIDRYGGPEVLVRRELPVPVPKPDEVLVRLAYSGINFMDVHTRQGKYARSTTYPQTLPTTLGIEGVGTVEAVGAEVADFRPGDRVGYCLCWGSYADFATVPAWRLIPLPPDLPFDRAVAAMFHGLTAHYLANDVGKLGPGVTCLVHAASGGIGQILVQMGVRLGATVYATTSTPEKAAIARGRGAAEVVTYDNGGFADRMRDVTGGRGVDVVFDAIGKPTLRDSFRATAKKGLVVAYGSVGGNVSDLDPIELGEAGSLFLTRPRLADHLDDVETIRRRAADIFCGLLDGSLSIDIGGRFSLDDVEAAHSDLEHRRNVGKPILKIG